MYRNRNQDDNSQQGNYGQPQNYGYSQQQEFYSPNQLTQGNFTGSQSLYPGYENEADYIRSVGGGQQTFGQGNYRPQSYGNPFPSGGYGSSVYGRGTQNARDNYGSQGNYGMQNRGNQGRDYRLSTGEYGYGGGSSSGMRNQGNTRGNFPESHNSYGQGGGYSSGMGARGDYGSAEYGYDHGHRYQQERYDNNLGFENRRHQDEGFIERAGDTLREGWHRAENAIRNGWNQVTHWGHHDRDQNRYGGSYHPDNRNTYDRGYEGNYGNRNRNLNEDEYNWDDRHRFGGNGSSWL